MHAVVEPAQYASTCKSAEMDSRPDLLAKGVIIHVTNRPLDTNVPVNHRSSCAATFDL